ncbi:MAG: transcriptional regulator [Paenibacillaceae bacterium]|nr:transcriptional regulator [Paenibacillaceae bacterium]
MWKSTFYRKTFILAILVSTIPVLLVGLFIYLFGTRHMEAELNNSHHQLTANAIKRIDTQLDHLEILATFWAFYSPFTSPLKQIDLYRDPDLVWQLTGNLTIIKSSDPLIEEVYVYLEKDNALISDTYGIQLPEKETAQAYRNLAGTALPIFWTNSFASSTASTVAPYSLIVRMSRGPSGSNILMIIKLNEQKFNAFIDGARSNSDGYTLLLHEDHSVISAGLEQTSSLGSVSLAALQELGKNKAEKQSFIMETNGEKYSVSYSPMRRIRTQWFLTTITPVSQLIQPVVMLSRYIMGISALMLAVGLVLSWFYSRRIYKPVQALFRVIAPEKSAGQPASDEFDLIAGQWRHLSLESQQLRQKLLSQLPALREGFLLHLLQGHYDSLSDEEIADKLRLYGRDTADRQWVLLVVDLAGLSRAGAKFEVGDEQLVTFAACNIIQELAETWPEPADVLNFHDLSLAVLLHLPALPEYKLQKGRLFKQAEELASSLHRHLNTDVTVGVSKPVQDIGELAEVARETTESLKHKQVHERLQVIDMEELLPHGDHVMEYPFDEEKKLLQGMRMGLPRAELELLADIFLERLREQARTELHVRHGLYQLFNAVQQTIIMSGYNPLQLYEGVILNEALAALKEPGAILSWLKLEVLLPFSCELERNQYRQTRQLVEQAVAFIHENYMKDISLEGCADLYGTYPRKLSIAFKQATGFTFIDYLTHYRLNKAMELLRQTNDKINDIAERVGYQPAYFHRLFKKHTGLTPGMFREGQEQG